MRRPRALRLRDGHAPWRTDFTETLEDLRKAVEAAGGVGQWEDLDDKHMFRGQDGVVITWFVSTKTLLFQGKPAARERYKAIGNGTAPAMSAGEKSGSYTATPSEAASPGSRVFVVHGHDDPAREQLELVIHKLGLNPFVLQNSSGGGLTIIEALEKEISEDASHFGIVLMTPDDVGYSKA